MTSETSDINIKVKLDEENVPSEIQWLAPGGGVLELQMAKAMMLGLWDGDKKEAVRIDLWTGKMGVDEMNKFYYQTFIGMADTYIRAPKNTELANELKTFAKSFFNKASEAIIPE